MQPTIEIPFSASAFLNTFNAGAVNRNVQYFYWIQALAAELKSKGHTVDLEYINGNVRSYYTLPDSAWLTVDTYRVYAPQVMQILAPDPVAWALTQVSNQKIWGRPKPPVVEE